MSCLGEVLGGAVPHQFFHKEKTYKVSLITQAVKLAYERHLYGKAKEAAAGMRELMNGEEYRQHLKELNDSYIMGEYAFESKRGLEYMQTAPGVLALASLLFDTDEMTLMKLVGERPDDVSSLIQLLVKESFPAEEGVQQETGEQKN